MKHLQQVADMAITAVVSGEHGLAISPPEWGKTETLAAVLDDVYGGGSWLPIEVSPSTNSAVIKGTPSVEAMMATPSRYVLDVTGTPRDTRIKAVLLDEIGRANEVFFDDLIHLMDAKWGNAPQVLATANFMPRGGRQAALLSRIGLWCYVEPKLNKKTIRKVVSYTYAKKPQSVLPAIPDGLSEFVEEMAAVKLDAAMINEIANMISPLYLEYKDMTRRNGYVPGLRRIRQAAHIVARWEMFLNWSTEITSISPESFGKLKFCSPQFDLGDVGTWSAMVEAFADPLGAALESATKSAYDALSKLESTSQEDLMEVVAEVSPIIKNVKSSLKEMAESNPADAERIMQVRNDIGQRFINVVSGGNDD